MDAHGGNDIPGTGRMGPSGVAAKATVRKLHEMAVWIRYKLGPVHEMRVWLGQGSC